MARSIRPTAKRGSYGLKRLDELYARLDELLENIEGRETVGVNMKNVFMDAAVEVRDQAIRLAPVRSGSLRSAILAAKGRKNKPSALVGVNYKLAPHAHLVEFGHGGPHPAPAHPYMRPAVAMKRDRVRQLITAGLYEVVQRYTK